MGIFRGLRAEGLGIIIATHDPNIASKADRVIELCDGRVVAGPQAM
jgi:ABC-type lipoprotein export system ATPase subunit